MKDSNANGTSEDHDDAASHPLRETPESTTAGASSATTSAGANGAQGRRRSVVSFAMLPLQQQQQVLQAAVEQAAQIQAQPQQQQQQQQPPPHAVSHAPQSGPRGPSTTTKGPNIDIRQRMDDIYAEMERACRDGRLRLPSKFLNFHRSGPYDHVLFLFVRASMGYALAFIKVKSLQKEVSERKSEDAARHARHARDWQALLDKALETQSSCATAVASAYARLVLHCSNYGNHKEDEHFFECVYFYACAVVKLGIAPEHWQAVEEELGYLFRGPQFTSNVRTHTAATQKKAAAIAAAAALEQATSTTATQKIQNLIVADPKAMLTRESTHFVVAKNRPVYFTEAVPVKKIVSEIDATKQRAARNMEIARTIRERIATGRTEAHRRQLDAMLSPRQSARLGAASEAAPMVVSEVHPPAQRGLKGSVSPRISMKSTFTARSPVLNHLLPATEDRVRQALKDHDAARHHPQQASKPVGADSKASADNNRRFPMPPLARK